MSEAKVEPAITPPNAIPATLPRGRPSGRRKWLFRLAAMTFVPTVLFSILELGLRAGGYGHSTRFFVNGAQYDLPDVWLDNRDFGRWAFPRKLEQVPSPTPFAFDVDKKPRTFRIFILGESAAQGFPEPSFNFGRILEVMLKNHYPEIRFEIVNTAMTAINSHIVLPIARECAERQPDLLIVHLGNNEVVGPFGPTGVLGTASPSRTAIQINLGIRRIRTGQLFDSFVNRLKGNPDRSQSWGGLSMFLESQIRFDDERLARTYSHFRANLSDVCRIGIATDIPVIACTIPVNLRDSSPFGSLHSPSLSQEQIVTWDVLYQEGVKLETEKQFAAAIEKYQAAGRIDDQFADLAFREGRCFAAMGKSDEACERFMRARDLDTLRFRSNGDVNRTIREVVAERSAKGVHLADAEKSFADASPMNMPGEELFLEHVHMNFSGNHLLAQTAFQTLSPILDRQFGVNPTTAALTPQQCAERLAYTDWNELKIVAHVRSNLLYMPPHTNQLDRDERDVRWKTKAQSLRARLAGGEFQKAIRIHQLAVEANKNDWMIRMNYGLLLTELGSLQQAEEQFRAILRQMPHHPTVHCKLGNVVLRMNQIDRAETEYRKALQLAPDDVEAKLGIAEVYGARGRVDEGLEIYEEQLKKSSDRANLLLTIGNFVLKAGRLDDAKVRFTESIKLNAENPIAHVSLANVALQQGNREEAIRQLEAALQIRPDWIDVQNRLSELKPDPIKSKKEK